MKRERDNQVLIMLMTVGSCFYVIPELLLMIIFYLKGSSLADWVPDIVKGAGILGGFALLMPAMKLAFCEPKQKNKGMVGRFVAGGMTAVFAHLLYDAFLGLLYVPLIKLGVTHPGWSIVLNVFIAIAFIVLQGVAVAHWVSGAMCTEDIPSWKQLMKRPIVLFEVIAAVFATNSVPRVVSWILGLLPMQIRLNIPIKLMIGLIIAALFACGLWLVLWIMRRSYVGKALGKEMTELKSEEKTEENLSEQVNTQVRRLRCIPPATVSAIGIAVILIVQTIASYSENPVDIIRDEIVDAGSLSGALLVAGDVEGGLQELQEAVLILNTWGGVLGMEDCPSLDVLYRENPSNPMVAYLYFTTRILPDDLARYLRVENMDPEFALAWLDMNAVDGISEDEQMLADELKYICAATGTYTSTALKVSDLDGMEEALEMELRKYMELKEQLTFLELAAEVVRGGVSDGHTVNRVLNYAEAHEENWVAQYLAAIVGSSYTYDGAGHYERTIVAASRFEKLYCSQNKLSNEELLGVQMKVAGMIMNCYGYQQAIPYLEKATELGGLEEAFSMAAQCYEALGEHEKCYDLCLEMLKKDPERLAARYYAAVNALKAGNRDAALEHTSKLADLAKKSVTKENYGADVALYSMLQFIVIRDNDYWTGYQYAFYHEMTEEQKALVAENTFLADYMEAVYQCFGTNASGHLDQALEAIERVLEKNSFLPQAWYLKGSIYFGNEDFTEAVDAYKQSLAIVPNSATTWFALANAYDGMEQYELAYQACERTMALIPVQDHGSDWYGVTVHCELLMNSLKSKLGG